MRKSVIVGLTLVCASVALVFPKSNDVLAAVGIYGATFIGCSTQRGEESGDGFVATLAQGPDAPDISGSPTCSAVLNALPSNCSIEEEQLAIDPRRAAFGALYRITCTP